MSEKCFCHFNGYEVKDAVARRHAASKDNPHNVTLVQIGALESIYPVGSIYMSVVNASPASFLGGTWEALQDRFLLGAGGTYSAGETGGETTHILTEAEMPQHTHKFGGEGAFKDWNFASLGMSGSVYPNDPALTKGGDYSDVGSLNLNVAGGSQAHNNMPPYLAVYMWKRIA